MCWAVQHALPGTIGLDSLDMFRESLLCVHASSAGCRRSLAKVQDHRWVQCLVGTILPPPPPLQPWASVVGFSSGRRQAGGCVQGALRTRGGSTGSTWPWGSLCAGAALSLRRGSSRYSEFLGLVALLVCGFSPFYPAPRLSEPRIPGV